MKPVSLPKCCDDTSGVCCTPSQIWPPDSKGTLMSRRKCTRPTTLRKQVFLLLSQVQLPSSVAHFPLSPSWRKTHAPCRAPNQVRSTYCRAVWKGATKIWNARGQHLEWKGRVAFVDQQKAQVNSEGTRKGTQPSRSPQTVILWNIPQWKSPVSQNVTRHSDQWRECAYALTWLTSCSKDKSRRLSSTLPKTLTFLTICLIPWMHTILVNDIVDNE